MIWLEKNTLSDVIQIKRMSFDVKIGLVESGKFNGEIVYSIRKGKDVKEQFLFRLDSIKDMAIDLAELVYPGVTGRRRRDVTDALRRAFPEKTFKDDFDVFQRDTFAKDRVRKSIRAAELRRRTSISLLLKYGRSNARMKTAVDEVELLAKKLRIVSPEFGDLASNATEDDVITIPLLSKEVLPGI